MAWTNKRHTGTPSRQLYLAEHPQHHVLLADLMALLSASHIARYDSLTAFQVAWPADNVREHLINGHLARIEAYVVRVCGPEGAAS